MADQCIQPVSRRRSATSCCCVTWLFLAWAFAAQLGQSQGSAGVMDAHNGDHQAQRYRRRRSSSSWRVISEKAPCVVLERQYHSSPLEKKWLEAAAKWKSTGNGALSDINPYCTLLTETSSDINRMLDLIKELMDSNTSLSKAPDADNVLSYFNITMQCGPYRVMQKEHIESLVAGLRHPFSIRCPASFSKLPPPTDIFDKGYILLASSEGQFQVALNKYYIDAGSGIGFNDNSNQFWMTSSYEARGFTLDRAIFWESKTASGAALLEGVPPHLFPAFTFYNIPASIDLDDGRNPLNVVTRLARTEDFVSVKIDIDAPTIEDGWLKAILDGGPTGLRKSPYALLIDELFWEHHFDFEPMRSCCWHSLVDGSRQLIDSMQMFVELRSLGIRSHYWQ